MSASSQFIDSLVRLLPFGNRVGNIGKSFCCAVLEVMSNAAPYQPVVDTPEQLETLDIAGFGDGQQVFVRNLEAFFYFHGYTNGAPPAVAPNLVTITARGGDSRFVREL